MEQALIKPIVRFGNSAGVLLPREWLNGEARIELVEKPLNIEKDVLEILRDYLAEIIGVYLVGSYARNEQTAGSDVDILVITQSINKNIKSGKYELILRSKQNLKKDIESNALPIIPMLREAKPIINAEELGNYCQAGITRKNIKKHLDLAKSALAMDKGFIEIEEIMAEEDAEKGIAKVRKISDNVLYSLVLRLRDVYIIECLTKGTVPGTKGFLKLVKHVAGSLEPYEAYKRSKNGSKALAKASVEQARKLYEYVSKKIKEIEKIK